MRRLDRTEFDTQPLYKVADITEVDTLIANRELDESPAARIRECGVELIPV